MSTYPTHDDRNVPYAGQFAWGAGICDFPDAIAGLGGLRMIVDGVESSRDVDYVDTESLVYRTFERMPGGPLLHRMMRARKTLELRERLA